MTQPLIRQMGKPSRGEGEGLAQGHTVRTANNHPQVVFVVNRGPRCWGPARGLGERGAHTTQGWAALGARRAPRREGWAHWACQGRRKQLLLLELTQLGR